MRLSVDRCAQRGDGIPFERISYKATPKAHKSRRNAGTAPPRGAGKRRPGSSRTAGSRTTLRTALGAESSLPRVQEDHLEEAEHEGEPERVRADSHEEIGSEHHLTDQAGVGEAPVESHVSERLGATTRRKNRVSKPTFTNARGCTFDQRRARQWTRLRNGTRGIGHFAGILSVSRETHFA